MALDTLNAAYEDLRAEVGYFLGYGRGDVVFSDSEWTTAQGEDIGAFLKSALRRFYKAHDWTFLRPRDTLTFATAAQTLLLPDDYASLDGVITVGLASGSLGRQLTLGSTADVMGRYAQSSDTTGLPQMLCEEAVPGSGKLPPRKQWRVWPAADQAYTLTFQYRIAGRMLSGSLPYAYGGAEHAETIVAAALATAELKADDLADGPHERSYQRHLAESIARDRRNQPQSLGLSQGRDQVCRPFLPVIVQGTISD